MNKMKKIYFISKIFLSLNISNNKNKIINIQSGYFINPFYYFNGNIKNRFHENKIFKYLNNPE